MNVDMGGGLVWGYGSPFRRKSEDRIGEPPLQEQGGAESSHGDVAGVLFTHKVGVPWDVETYWAMPHQFGGGLQELAEVS